MPAFLVFLALISPAVTQQANPPTAAADSIRITGVATSGKGPLANQTLLVMPLNAQGKPVTLQAGAEATLSLDASRANATAPWRYYYSIVGNAGLGRRLNPETRTDAQGRFSVTVPRTLLSRSSKGRLALGVFDRGRSDFNPHVVEVPSATTVLELGGVTFQLVPEPKR